jgi:hypothetical protein
LQREHGVGVEERRARDNGQACAMGAKCHRPHDRASMLSLGGRPDGILRSGFWGIEVLPTILPRVQPQATTEK